MKNKKYEILENMKKKQEKCKKTLNERKTFQNLLKFGHKKNKNLKS